MAQVLALTMIALARVALGGTAAFAQSAMPCLAEVQNAAGQLQQTDAALRAALAPELGKIGALAQEAIAVSAHATVLAASATAIVTTFGAGAPPVADNAALGRQDTVQRWRAEWDSIHAKAAATFATLAARATSGAARKAARDARATYDAARNRVASCVAASVSGA